MAKKTTSKAASKSKKAAAPAKKAKASAKNVSSTKKKKVTKTRKPSPAAKASDAVPKDPGTITGTVYLDPVRKIDSLMDDLFTAKPRTTKRPVSERSEKNRHNLRLALTSKTMEGF